MLKSIFKSKITKLVRRLYRPREAFVEKTRGLFLSAYWTRFPKARPAVAHAPAKGWRLVFQTGVATLGAAVLVGGATVYADFGNVGATSILYPLKREGEQVRLALTPTAAQPALHAEFAARRLAEVVAVQAAEPTSPQTAQLANDFHTELKLSLAGLASAESPLPTTPPAAAPEASATPVVSTSTLPPVPASLPIQIVPPPQGASSTSTPWSHRHHPWPQPPQQVIVATSVPPQPPVPPPFPEHGSLPLPFPANPLATSASPVAPSGESATPGFRSMPVCGELRRLFETKVQDARNAIDGDESLNSAFQSTCDGPSGTPAASAPTDLSSSTPNGSGSSPRHRRTGARREQLNR